MKLEIGDFFSSANRLDLTQTKKNENKFNRNEISIDNNKNEFSCVDLGIKFEV